MADTPNEERLEELQDDIDRARRQAEEHGTLPDSTPQPTFIDPDGDGEPDRPVRPPA